VGRTRSQLSAQLELVDRSRLAGFVVLLALLAFLGRLVFTITHLCPKSRLAAFSPPEVVLELDRQHLPPFPLRDPAVEAHGGIAFESSIGQTGIIAIVWPDDRDEQVWPHDDERASLAGTWERRLTPNYERYVLNVGFYALRGGSEADRSRVRVAISRASRHLYPLAPPSLCPADE
jgi:hypothetical protein